jgi:hypothetical protein
MMKTTFFSMLSMVCMLCFQITGSAQTADEIINKYLQALGGQEKLKTIQTVVMEGSLSVQGFELPVKLSSVHNKGVRQDFSLNGMNGYSILTPTNGWNFNPFQGQTKPEPITADDINEGINQLDIQSPFMDYAVKGHAIELLEKEDIEGTECHKIRFTYKNGKEEFCFFDPSTFYLVRQKSKTKANGQEIEVVSDLSSYSANEQGFVFPMTIGSAMGTITMKSIKVNTTVPETLFTVDK